MSLQRFWLTEDSEFLAKNAVWGILLHEQQVVACCQTHFNYKPSNKQENKNKNKGRKKMAM